MSQIIPVSLRHMLRFINLFNLLFIWLLERLIYGKKSTGFVQDFSVNPRATCYFEKTRQMYAAWVSSLS